MSNKCYVAYFDILGYKERIKSLTLEEEYNLQVEIIKDAFFSREYVKDKVKQTHFSDTYLYYTTDDTESSFVSIILASVYFMMLTVGRRKPYLPIRGAIYYGDFIADRKNNIFIGEAMREAYGLEKEQDWMGCCLSKGCVEKVKNYSGFKRLLTDKILVKYNVPFKEGESLSSYALNMESVPRKTKLKIPMTDKEFIKNIFINKGLDNKVLELDEEAELKLYNTIEFYRHIKSVTER